MKPIIFYHGQCLDGFAGAWAAWKKFGNAAEYRGVSHDLNRIPTGITGRTVYFIDYCLSEALMRRALARTRRCIVIDHHATHRTIAGMADESVFSLSKSGCVLAWNYFHPKKNPPQLLLAIQDYDLFTLKRKHTLEIATALTLAEREFDAWSNLVRDFADPLLRKTFVLLGSLLMRYKDECIDRILESAQRVVFHGHRAYAVNTSAFYSEVGTRMYQTRPVHLGIVWYYRNGRMKVSLRSDGRIDCGALAIRYGGGGHVGAAAFWLPFKGEFPWRTIGNGVPISLQSKS
ncbi:hypothetical protein HY623_01450 [Candidatus Uhrbacteria bacterium]|nr:hypothetical protein [Candidatus Uhrbacteria bacterium]